MSRPLHCLLAQYPPLDGEPDVAAFARQVEDALTLHPDARFVAFPEMHLFGGADAVDDDAAWYRERAETIGGPLTEALGDVAATHHVWLVPGSVPERGRAGELFNTALVFSPGGRLAHTYRKAFPWRPAEPWANGGTFSTFAVPDVGVLGVNICYDSWYPETTRQIAWMGAEAVLNIVKTTTPDREQELVLARANAIVNQVFYLSVNTAGPRGRGRSVVVGPEGEVLHESPDDGTELIAVTIDLDDVTGTRGVGTAGTNRLWAQMRDGDARIELPAYGGAIDPATWNAHTKEPGDV